MVLEKKKAAAIAAVMNYIKSEEEMVVAQAAAGRGGVQPPARPPVSINLWGLSGRQAMMQMRNQMQMRGFHGARFR
ncbi:MAG: hypothetical protein WBM78_15990 [Desulfobacterales bacterium]